jgi:hypothetical protein
MFLFCARFIGKDKKAVTNFVTAFFVTWAIQGLNLGPPDYEATDKFA